MDRAQYVPDAPYTRALAWNENATNATLVRYTVKAARDAWPFIAWPREIPRERAARVVHNFAREAITYRKETGDQLTRMPWRSIEDGEGDCKSLAVLVGSLCRAAGCDVVLRFVRYPGEDHFGHVFAIVDGVPVDPELPFGMEVDAAGHLDRWL